MNLNIRVCWPAWLWMNSTADIISAIFADLGFNVLTDIEYQSLIKWWVNYFDIFSSDKNQYLTKKVDIILALNDKNLEAFIPDLKDWWFIISNKKWISNLKEKVDFSKFNVLELDINDKYDNTYLLWILVKLLNLDLEIILSKIDEVFWRKWEVVVNLNKQIIRNIYETYEISKKCEYSISKIWESRKVLYWNKAFTLWAISWWLEYYSAYPMTPASTILSEVIKNKTVKYLQAEDEIAVINSALWASYTWARSMVWTSGGGFALMTEALSFAIQAEIPITAVLAQRAWPSTWTPTFHEAWDLNFALNPTFWDFEHIVIYPSTLEEAYYFGWWSLNLADKYQGVVLVLVDKQSSELHGTFGELKVPEIDRWKMLENPSTDYKRYELVEDWISPRVKVWTPNGDFIATSYEHDEYWATTEESEMKVLMTEKRFKKLKDFYKKENIFGYEVFQPHPNPLLWSRGNEENSKPKKIIITTSFTSYTAKEFVRNNPEFGLIIIKVLKPLDERLLEELKGCEEVIFAESNYSWQLENYISKELGLKYIKWLKVSNIRKYDLYPFYYEDFEELKNRD